MTEQIPWLQQLSGKWSGTYDLYLKPDDLANTGEILIEVNPKIGDQYIEMSYSHLIDDVSYEAVFLINTSSLNAVWIDQYHTASAIMELSGKYLGDMLVLSGSYHGTGESWGWTIELRVEKSKLTMQHYNHPPDADHYLGVDILCHRKEI